MYWLCASTRPKLFSDTTGRISTQADVITQFRAHAASSPAGRTRLAESSARRSTTRARPRGCGQRHHVDGLRAPGLQHVDVTADCGTTWPSSNRAPRQTTSSGTGLQSLGGGLGQEKSASGPWSTGSPRGRRRRPASRARRAALSALRQGLELHLAVDLAAVACAGCGPKTTPPPTQIGERFEPARARPVPFWRHGLAATAAEHPTGSWSTRCAPRRGRQLLGDDFGSIKGSLICWCRRARASSSSPDAVPAAPRICAGGADGAGLAVAIGRCGAAGTGPFTSGMLALGIGRRRPAGRAG